MGDWVRELGIPEEKIFYKSPDGSIVIVNDDFLNANYIKPNSIDLIVTSPPYNVDIEYEGYRDNIPYDKYLEFTEKCFPKDFYKYMASFLRGGGFLGCYP
mgnify:CR=1 FL=1